MQILNELRGTVSIPDQEIFKIGPEVIEEFLSKALVVMGAKPGDIRNIKVSHEKKKLKLLVDVDKDSRLFCQPGESNEVLGLALLGRPSEEINLTDQAESALRQLGFYYRDEDNRDVYLVNLVEYKKYVELEFNAEVTLAIISDSNFLDEYFIVDGIEEVIIKSKKEKKKYDSHKFKGKKQTVVFCKLQRSYGTSGFHPNQVIQWKTGSNNNDWENED